MIVIKYEYVAETRLAKINDDDDVVVVDVDDDDEDIDDVV